MPSYQTEANAFCCKSPAQTQVRAGDCFGAMLAFRQQASIHLQTDFSFMPEVVQNACNDYTTAKYNG